jgi:putative MATE family efflux protein
VIFSTSRGRRDENTAQAYFTLSVLYGAVLSILAVACIGFFNEPLFRFFGADDELLKLAKGYLAPILYALPCCLFSCILSAFLRNDGNPGLATKAVIIGGIFNVIGDYLCVFVLDMGIFGAGLATAIGQFVSVGVMLLHFVGKKNTLRFVKVTQAVRKLGSITVTGFSTAINDLALGVIGVLFNRQIMKYLNSDALAVYGVITQVTVFAQCLAYGAGQAAQPIISQNFGAGQNDRIKQCLKYGLYTSAVMGLCWTGVMLLVPNLFVNFFMTPTASVLEIAPGIIRAYGISYILLPLTELWQACLREDTQFRALCIYSLPLCDRATHQDSANV